MVVLFVERQGLNMAEKKSTFDRTPKASKYDAVDMPSRFDRPPKKDKYESVEMPSRVGGSNKQTINIPDFGEVERDKIKALKHGGKVSSASKRADGCAIKGKTRA